MEKNEAPTDDPAAKRVLCLGDLGWAEERKCDLRYFLNQPDTEFVHVGLTAPKHALGRSISLSEAAARFRAGRYDVVVAGAIPAPFANPRKGFLHRWSNVAANSRRLPAACNALRAERLLALFAPRLVVIDLEDRPIIDNRRFAAAAFCQLYFKRELPQNPANAFLYTTAKNEDNGNIPRQPFFASLLPKLRPISIGVEPSILARGQAMNRGKTADVFFAGRVENRPNRPSGMKQLLRLREEGFRIDLPEAKISRPEFFERCAAALAVWSPEGFGYDCTRTYETAAMASVPILQYPTIQRHAPLVDGEHALYYGIEGDHLYRMLKSWLARPDALNQMGRNAQAQIARHHTFDQLGQHIVATAKSVIDRSGM